MAEVTAAFVIIGNEILSGRTIDKNLHFIATNLSNFGVNLKEVRVVRDEENAIIKAVNETRKNYDFVFTSGGIGPTHDDITAASIAKAFSVKLIRDPVAKKILEQHYQPSQLNEARLKMSDIPEGAILLNNPVSSAPGFKIENVFVMAGVPKIMQAMFIAAKDFLRYGDKISSKTISVFIAEGDIAAKLTEVQNSYSEIEIGSYPFIKEDHRLGTSLVFRGIDGTKLDAATREMRNFLVENKIEIEEKSDENQHI